MVAISQAMAASATAKSSRTGSRTRARSVPRLNPRLLGAGTPPIPEAAAWARRYDGASGPLIDLSQAVPGTPPHAELLERLGRAAADPAVAAYGPILGEPALRDAYAA